MFKFIATLFLGLIALNAQAATACIKPDATSTVVILPGQGASAPVSSAKADECAVKPAPAKKTAAKKEDSNASAFKALAEENLRLKTALEAGPIRTTVTPFAPQAATVTSNMVPVAMPPTKSKHVLVTFGYRARIFDQEGNLMAFRYVKDESSSNEFEANFRAKVADPDAVLSVQEYRQVEGSAASAQQAQPATNVAPSPAQAPASQPKQVANKCPNGLVFGKVIADISDQNGRSLKGQTVCTEAGNPSVQPL